MGTIDPNAPVVPTVAPDTGPVDNPKSSTPLDTIANSNWQTVGGFLKALADPALALRNAFLDRAMNLPLIFQQAYLALADQILSFYTQFEGTVANTEKFYVSQKNVNASMDTYNTGVTTATNNMNAAIAAYNQPNAQAVATYNAATLAYNTALATYNSIQPPTTASQNAYNAALTTYNAATAAYNANVNTPTPASTAAYAAAVNTYNAAILSLKNTYNGVVLPYNATLDQSVKDLNTDRTNNGLPKVPDQPPAPVSTLSSNRPTTATPPVTPLPSATLTHITVIPQPKIADANFLLTQMGPTVDALILSVNSSANLFATITKFIQLGSEINANAPLLPNTFISKTPPLFLDNASSSNSGGSSVQVASAAAATGVGSASVSRLLDSAVYNTILVKLKNVPKKVADQIMTFTLTLIAQTTSPAALAAAQKLSEDPALRNLEKKALKVIGALAYSSSTQELIHSNVIAEGINKFIENSDELADLSTKEKDDLNTSLTAVVNLSLLGVALSHTAHALNLPGLKGQVLGNVEGIPGLSGINENSALTETVLDPFASAGLKNALAPGRFFYDVNQSVVNDAVNEAAGQDFNSQSEYLDFLANALAKRHVSQDRIADLKERAAIYLSTEAGNPYLDTALVPDALNQILAFTNSSTPLQALANIALDYASTLQEEALTTIRSAISNVLGNQVGSEDDFRTRLKAEFKQEGVSEGLAQQLTDRAVEIIKTSKEGVEAAKSSGSGFANEQFLTAFNSFSENRGARLSDALTQEYVVKGEKVDLTLELIADPNYLTTLHNKTEARISVAFTAAAKNQPTSPEAFHTNLVNELVDQKFSKELANKLADQAVQIINNSVKEDVTFSDALQDIVKTSAAEPAPSVPTALPTGLLAYEVHQTLVRNPVFGAALLGPLATSLTIREFLTNLAASLAGTDIPEDEANNFIALIAQLIAPPSAQPDAGPLVKVPPSEVLPVAELSGTLSGQVVNIFAPTLGIFRARDIADQIVHSLLSSSSLLSEYNKQVSILKAQKQSEALSAFVNDSIPAIVSPNVVLYALVGQIGGLMRSQLDLVKTYLSPLARANLENAIPVEEPANFKRDIDIRI